MQDQGNRTLQSQEREVIQGGLVKKFDSCCWRFIDKQYRLVFILMEVIIHWKRQMDQVSKGTNQ